MGVQSATCRYQPSPPVVSGHIVEELPWLWEVFTVHNNLCQIDGSCSKVNGDLKYWWFGFFTPPCKHQYTTINLSAYQAEQDSFLDFWTINSWLKLRFLPRIQIPFCSTSIYTSLICGHCSTSNHYNLSFAPHLIRKMVNTPRNQHIVADENRPFGFRPIFPWLIHPPGPTPNPGLCR